MPKEIVEILSRNRNETFQLANRLAGSLQAGDVVALTGELGSGKTVFAQGVCSGLGIQEAVTSPTFTLIQEYKGRFDVYHFDFYRLETDRDIEELDLVRYLDLNGVCLIEWAERGRAFYPERHYWVELSRVADHNKIHPDLRKIRIVYPDGFDPTRLAA